MKKYYLTFMFLALFPLMGASCATTKVVVDESKFIVIDIPSTLLDCPVKISKPNPDTATNQQIVNYINRLEVTLAKCGVNSRKIREYISEAKKIYNATNG